MRSPLPSALPPSLGTRRASAALALGGALLAACHLSGPSDGFDGAERCGRNACLAFETERARGSQSAIAGLVAFRSDVVSNGCEDCEFTSETVAFWPVDATIDDAALASERTREPPAIALDALQRYHQRFAPGLYLACCAGRCLTVGVEADRVTTLNIRVQNGWTKFVVFDATRNGEATFGLDVPVR